MDPCLGWGWRIYTACSILENSGESRRGDPSRDLERFKFAGYFFSLSEVEFVPSSHLHYIRYFPISCPYLWNQYRRKNMRYTRSSSILEANLYIAICGSYLRIITRSLRKLSSYGARTKRNDNTKDDLSCQLYYWYLSDRGRCWRSADFLIIFLFGVSSRIDYLRKFLVSLQIWAKKRSLYYSIQQDF